VFYTGGAGNDLVSGTFTGLIGSQYADSLVGSTTNDTIFGGRGNDTIDGGRGNDLLDGGVGYDFLSFAFSTAAINASLANSSVSSGGYLGTYTNFEGLIGSAYSDSLSGDTTANYLYGMAGNDTLFGGDGADTLQGGANSDSIDGGTNSGSGIDMVDYTYTTAALTITLNGASSGSGSSFTVNVASGDLDTVRNVEGILSGGGADSLTGDSLANYIDGGAGNDTIIGGGGADSLFGGAGSDLLRLDWSSINLSKLDAGSGTDTVSFANSTNDITLSGSSFSNLLSNAEYLDFSGTNGTVSLSLGGDDVQKLLTGSSSTSSYTGVLDLKFDALGDSLSLLNNGSYSYWNSSDVNATTGKFNDGTNFSISGSTQQYVYVFDTNHTTLLATLYLHT
jgi:Ca2+-binding RTX toxin-like protein